MTGSWESNPQLWSNSVSVVDWTTPAEKFSDEPGQLMHSLL